MQIVCGEKEIIILKRNNYSGIGIGTISEDWGLVGMGI